MRRMTDCVLIAVMLIALSIAGCETAEEDPRLHQLSRESLTRQAEQNVQMGRQSEAVAQAAKELVEADAQARREAVALHQAIQQERADLDRQHEDLEKERREIAATRQRDPILANAIAGACLLLATTLPLLLCLFLVRGLYDRDPTNGLEDLLIAELSGAGHGLLNVQGQATPRLNAGDRSGDDRPERLPPPSPDAG